MAENQERNRFSKRLGRYARVGAGGGRLAAGWAAGKVLGRDEDGSRAAALKNILGNLRGPLMKVAQLLATIPGIVPREYARELQELQANAPAMGWPFVRRRMQAELGGDWQEKFASFERGAAAAASLGQVHRAVHHDGRALACKLQYPDMESVVAADLKQLRLLMSLFEKWDKTIDTQHIYREVEARLYEELDYKREARSCGYYHTMLGETPNVHVPEVISELSTSRLLTATWLEGKPIMGMMAAPQETRDQLALNLFQAWYVPLYKYGIIHGDPHPGNYTVCEDLSINLLDFGCIRVFKPRFVNGVIDLYYALLENDEERAVHAYEAWGFTGLSKEVIEILNIWARFLYGPILEDKDRIIGELSETAVYGRETAAKVHAELKKHSAIAIPQEFVFMDRAALGLGSIFIRLQAKVNWYRLFNEMIEGFDKEVLRERQRKLIDDQ